MLPFCLKRAAKFFCSTLLTRLTEEKSRKRIRKITHMHARTALLAGSLRLSV